MGTRSLTKVVDRGQTILCIYRQFDGYPGGHGRELAEFLKGITIVNGLGMGDKKVANGYGCLAAQLVKHLKTEPGGIYIYPPDSSDCGEEYTYTIEGSYKDTNGNFIEPKAPILKVQSSYNEDEEGKFEGTATEFLKWLKKKEADDET